MEITQNKYYSLRSKAFNPNYLKSLEQEILASPYLAESKLSEHFAETQGFSIVFQRSGIEMVAKQFPFLQPYLQTALMPQCNVFYLNPLIVQSRAYVQPHVDCSIAQYCHQTVIPKMVSVLYVRVPSDMEGGELILTRKGNQVGKIQPQENTLLYFHGSLTHSVNQVRTSQSRISLVCEQYVGDLTQYQQIPQFQIESKAYAV
ncbi:2OG-Fe(II) oxygenase [Pleurocapsa sp. PCC 7319]|uniref:2OG-Fe(II) oxygenase n=1 Tax=Pleurocapsa sp. PCC 7319 TaxID=118161 RepID=UPI000345768F|nr:2OG-Fe(II) oxygenase [Pleurocapsa sp. PCC 7319]